MIFLVLGLAWSPAAFSRDAEIDQQVRTLKAIQQEMTLGGAGRKIEAMRALASQRRARKLKGQRSRPPRDHQEALGAQGTYGPAVGLRSRTAEQPANRLITTSAQPFTTQSEVSVAGTRAAMVAAWNDAGSHQNQFNAISFATSTDGGQVWREGGPLPVGGQVLVWVSDPVVAVDARRGDFYVAGLVIATGASSGVAVARGRFGESGFQWEAPRVARAVRDSFPDKPWMVADSLTGNLYLSYTTFYRRDGKSTDRIEFQRSEDGGLTWSSVARLSPESEEGLVQGSRPAVGPLGELHVVWKTIDTTAAAGGEDAMRIRSSWDGGRTFSETATVARLYTNFCSGPPGFDRGFGLGFPSIAVDRSAGPHRGRIHVGWEESLNFYDDRLAAAGGVQEEAEPNNRHRDATPFTVGDVLRGTISPAHDVDWFRFHGEAGRTVVLYVDSLDAHLDVALRLWCGDGSTRLAYSTSLNVRQRIVLFTVTTPGDYYVSIAPHDDSTGVYRLASGWAERGSERGRDQRDIFVAHSDDGITWSTPALAGDAPAGFDDWLPELAVGTNGTPYVAWYDFREGDPSGCGAASHIRLSRSDDGGDHWVPVGLVTDYPTLWSGVFSNQSPNMGDYIGLLAGQDGIVPAWADGRDANPDVYAAFWPTAEAARDIAPLASEPSSGGVVLRWQAPPIPVTGTVWRRVSGGSARALADIDPDPQGVMSYLDVDLDPGFRYHYELAVRSSEGEVRVGQQSIDAPGASAAALALERVAPNPSHGVFRIAFSRPHLAPARLDVLDVGGRRVMGVDLGEEYGTRGVLDLGRQTRLDPGLYLVRFVQAGESVSVKAVVVR
ncbi:MAG TPA: hypothetical protein VFQ05_07040 [Candidatus Eisenbacteria bacterium]|nr:hypothetical protein [Candidatus Eisenbacteria bacterium]